VVDFDVVVVVDAAFDVYVGSGGGKRKQGCFNFITKGRHSSLAREKKQG